MNKSQHTHIVSATPGRTRLRVSPKRRNPQEMARIANALQACPKIDKVVTNVQTGSIVVCHHETSGFSSIAETLQDLGVVLASITNVDIPFFSGGKSAAADDLTNAVVNLNRQVGLATNGLIDLRLIIPLGLTTLAIKQLLRNGWQIEAAPWYVLAYYAFDSFIKLHYTQEK